MEMPEQNEPLHYKQRNLLYYFSQSQMFMPPTKHALMVPNGGSAWQTQHMACTCFARHCGRSPPLPWHSGHHSTGSRPVPGVSRTSEGVLVPVSKRQHAVVFTHNCTHTHILRHMHLHILQFCQWHQQNKHALSHSTDI